MRTKLITTLAGLLLAIGAGVALPASPAGAHNFDNYSLYSCAVHRPNGTVVIHSGPYYMTPGDVRYRCISDIYGTSFQYFVRWDQDNETITLISGYQKCKPAEGGIVWCTHP